MPTKATKKPTQKIILLDSHAIIHRAYHALPDFASAKGEPTGALYGLISMLLSIVQELKPDYIVAAFDLPTPTYRHEVYKEYKAGRKKTDPALVAQLIRARDVFTAFGVPTLDSEGFEADDVLGTLVEQLKDTDHAVIIASGDMDTLQLVSGKKVQVYTLRKGIKDTILYDEKTVKERYGFGPERIPDYKGLRGDTSDNIIGIRGIGEKTATQLITAYGPIEKMYAALKKDRAAVMKKAGVTERVAQLLFDGEEEAEFSKTLATIRRDAPITYTVPEKTWREAFSLDAALKLCQELDFRTLAARIKNVLGDTRDAGDTDDGFVDSPVSVVPAAPIDDISPEQLKELKVIVWLLNSNLTNPTADDILSQTKTDTLSAAYAVATAELKKTGLSKVYETIEHPLISIIDTMNAYGVCVDKEHLATLSKVYHTELAILETTIWKHAGEEFNINSPKQLGVILFEKLDLAGSRQKKTAGGALSTREEELEKLREKHPVIADILQYRQLQKLLSTYIDAIPVMVEQDGRLRATFIQTGASTGRMSSQSPNLQNIPIKTELGRAIRKAFVAEKGSELLAFDYSQIELRIAAFLSHDEKLLEIFKSGRDVHTEVAAYVFKLPAAEVTKEMRRQAKVINFGILYGMGVNALKQNLGTDRATAQKFYNDYFATFTMLAQYLDSVRASAADTGYTETFFGRRRYFEGMQSHIPYIKASAERMAINAPIQGTGADILKLAMVNIDAALRAQKLTTDVHLIMQIHDELVYEVTKDQVQKTAEIIRAAMEQVLAPEQIEGVTLIVEGSHGPSYGEMEDFGK